MAKLAATIAINGGRNCAMYTLDVVATQLQFGEQTPVLTAKIPRKPIRHPYGTTRTERTIATMMPRRDAAGGLVGAADVIPVAVMGHVYTNLAPSGDHAGPSNQFSTEVP
ncbi:hypothetical protein, partial [Glaciihabitans sp. dw_435]|uniref:hypothetical protein n=1 Tax=Glaciihabitans sp. dw_435 TaxID=2720081 RepID=UPI001BD29FCC